MNSKINYSHSLSYIIFCREKVESMLRFLMIRPSDAPRTRYSPESDIQFKRSAKKALKFIFTTYSKLASYNMYYDLTDSTYIRTQCMAAVAQYLSNYTAEHSSDYDEVRTWKQASEEILLTLFNIYNIDSSREKKQHEGEMLHNSLTIALV